MINYNQAHNKIISQRSGSGLGLPLWREASRSSDFIRGSPVQVCIGMVIDPSICRAEQRARTTISRCVMVLLP